MAGGINIFPNPGVLATLIGFFIINFFLVKKFFVDSFLKLRTKQENLTTGSEAEAEKLIKECEVMSTTIQDKTKMTLDDVKTTSITIIEEATKKQQQIISQAQSEAKKEVESIKAKIDGELKTQLEKLPEISTKIMDEMYKSLTRH